MKKIYLTLLLFALFLLGAKSAYAFVPVANFVASDSVIFEGSAITFTDLSTRTPTSWLWDFPSGTPNTSTLQNPTVTYNTPGTYSVTLTATNGSGSGSRTKTNYIEVFGTPVPNNAGVISIDSTETFCGDMTNQVFATVANYGTNVINSLTITLQINGMTVSNGFLPQPLDTAGGSGPDTLSISVGSFFFVADSLYDIQVFSSFPNGVQDTVNYNDTVSLEWMSQPLEAVATPSNIAVGDSSSLVAVGAAVPLLFTEVVQNKGGTGSTSPYPGYLGSSDFDGIEIQNFSNFPFDVEGFTVLYESNGTGTFTTNGTYTFPAGATVPPNGVLLLMKNGGMDDPANNVYYTTVIGNPQSTSVQGYVLRDQSGNIVDAVALNGLTFSPASGVTPGDWSGSIPSSSGFAGVTRTAPSDNNTASDWTIPSASSRQTFGTPESGISTNGQGSNGTVTWSGPGGFSATGVAVSTGPLNFPGSYTYTATFTINGCTIVDMVTVNVGITAIGDDLVAKQSFNIYPNPSNGLFTIDLTDVRNGQFIEIFDLQGNLVRRSAMGSKSTVNIDLQEYQRGIYFLRVITDKEVFNQRLILN